MKLYESLPPKEGGDSEPLIGKDHFKIIAPENRWSVVVRFLQVIFRLLVLSIGIYAPKGSSAVGNGMEICAMADHHTRY